MSPRGPFRLFQLVLFLRALAQEFWRFPEVPSPAVLLTQVDGSLFWVLSLNSAQPLNIQLCVLGLFWLRSKEERH